MILIHNYQLRQKYKGFKRNISDITEIVIHGSGGGDSSLALINWMASPLCERIPFYLKGIGLFPYTINYDGLIYQIMPDEDWYYHSDAGLHDSHSIGIEMMNSGIKNSGDYTDAQYKALNELISELYKKFPDIINIHSHDANRRMFSNMPPKPCPGKKFNWSKIEEYITDNINKTTMIVRG